MRALQKAVQARLGWCTEALTSAHFEVIRSDKRLLLERKDQMAALESESEAAARVRSQNLVKKRAMEEGVMGVDVVQFLEASLRL